MKRDYIGAAAYNLIDILSSKVFRIIAFILLARWLATEAIGIIGISEGFLAILGYLEFSFISILYRDNRRQRHAAYFSAAVYFWLMQSLVMLVIGLGAGVCLAVYRDNWLLLPAIAGQALSFAMLAGTDIARTYFGLDLRQRFICGINLFLGLVYMASLLLLAGHPGILAYTVLLTANALLGMIVWIRLLRRRYGLKLQAFGDTIPLIRRSFGGFALWNHLNKSAYDAILMIDTFILGLFVSLSEVGSYTIALKFTSMFLIIPTLMSNMITIFLSRMERDAASHAVVNLSVKYGLLFSLLQIILFLTAGRSILIHLLPGADIGRIFIYALLMNLGTLFLNVSRPFQSLIVVRGRIKEAFYKVYLPMIFYSLTVYILFAWRWGTIGAALANITVYGIAAILLLRYVSGRSLFVFNWQWFSPVERELLADYRRKVPGGIGRDES